VSNAEDLALVEDDIRAVVQGDPSGIHPHRSDKLAVLLAAFDEARADLARLRGIEQRASMAAGDDEPRMPPGDPSPFQAVITARYILRGDAL
jgi:hypothetical protein